MDYKTIIKKDGYRKHYISEDERCDKCASRYHTTICIIFLYINLKKYIAMIIEMSNILDGVVNTVSSAVSYFNNSTFDLLGQDKEILKIGNVLNSIFIDRETIDIPRLVVVGSQSSGKSSILNSILGMDILPTGTNMVTRGPLQLELIQSTEDVKAVFGKYKEGRWSEIKSIDIQFPNPTPDQRTDISSTIEALTNSYAGPGMNITNKPINLRIHSPNIPNLNLVDLPGLTMVACTDKGQPKDIKDKIKSLIAEYISKKETIIMAIMPARSDIEADIALDLIKEYDPNGQRTIGILTKIDLMNKGTDVSNLLENKISKDLQLGYNYYCVKNRNKEESDTMNVQEGLKAEQSYFSSHKVYKKYTNKCGIPALCKTLSDILVKQLKKGFPTILEKIDREIQLSTIELERLGTSISDEGQQHAFIHRTMSNITRSFISILEDRGKIVNTGRNIKELLMTFRKEIQELIPFSSEYYSDQYIKEAITNCEGNHMSSASLPIEVLEQLMRANKRPILMINEYSKKCCQSIMNELNNLVDIIVKEQGIDRFPNFSKLIIATLNETFLSNLKQINKDIHYELECQENYIWTEDAKFIETLKKNNECNVKSVRNLAEGYYNSIVYILQDTIPKRIMLTLVSNSQREMNVRLYEKIKTEKSETLLLEYDDISVRRDNLSTKITELIHAKELITCII
jgi:GTP-binding protein EngB required for normal cell division